MTGQTMNMSKTCFEKDESMSEQIKHTTINKKNYLLPIGKLGK